MSRSTKTLAEHVRTAEHLAANNIALPKDTSWLKANYPVIANAIEKRPDAFRHRSRRTR
jgi:hypothetical protein